MDDVVLLPYEAGRLDELIAMWRASFEFGVSVVDPNPLEAQREFFVREILPNNDVRLAVKGDRLVGFIAASQESIPALYVHVDAIGQGIGTLLLDWAKAQSGGRLWLYTFERNTRAQRFYESSGFTITERGFEEDWQLADLKYEWAEASSA
jgi:ribosomal protein S18 acetylase RimI-like enzyme